MTEKHKTSSQAKKERRIKELESKYKGQYGEYKYYAGQVYVFKDGDIANKTLHVSDREKDHDNRPYLKFRARPVYLGDTQEDLEEVIRDWEEEDEWYLSEFGNIPRLEIPREKYRICKDPLGTKNNTILISTKWVDNIEGDIFRIEAEKLYSYLTGFPGFRETMTKLIEKFLELSKEDIYPDYIGIDNVAIYTKNGIPNIALIDTHIVWIKEYCSDTVKGRLDRATSRFKRFLKDPLDIDNIRYLTSKGLMGETI